MMINNHIDESKKEELTSRNGEVKQTERDNQWI